MVRPNTTTCNARAPALPETRSPPRWLARNMHACIAFLSAILIMLIAYAVLGAYPYGAKTILTTDLFHQYAPFMAELQHKLRHGESLFYSWNGGLGFNFYATIAYYLASPINLLLPAFPAGWLAEAILTITLVKIGLAAAFFAVWVREEFGNNDFSGVAFSLMYALSGYVLAYAWNLMWMDGIVLLPLVALGLSRLIRGGAPTLYVGALALLLFSNFYIAFSACLFLFLYLPILMVKHGWGQKPGVWLGKILAFAGASLLAAGIAAVVLLPAFEALRHTSAAADPFPSTLAQYFDPLSFIGRHFVAAPPNNKSGLPNLYCGIAVLLLLPLHLLDPGVSRRERAAHLLLLAFLLLGFNLNVLNFIWHGFHFPNMLPYRNAYVYAFLLVTVCVPAFTRNRPAPRGRTLLCLAGALLLVLLSRWSNDPKLGLGAAGLSILFLILYFVIITSRALDTRTWISRSGAFALVVMLEIGVHAVLAVGAFEKDMGYAAREGYAAGGDTGDIRDALKALRLADSSFWRAEVTPRISANDPQLYRYRGLGLFSSMSDRAMAQMAVRYGFHGNDFNSYEYIGQTPFMDAVLGIRYLLRRSSPPVDDPIRERIMTRGTVSVFANPGALALGFTAPSAAKTWRTTENRPLDNQNALAEMLTGTRGLFVPLALPTTTEVDGATLTRRGNNAYEMQWPDKRRQAVAKVHFAIAEEQTLYLDVRPCAQRFFVGCLRVGDRQTSFGSSFNTVLEVGRVQPGTRVSVELWGAPLAGGPYNFTLIPYELNVSRHHDVIKRLSSRSLHVTRVGDSSVSGVAGSNQDGILVLTIPYSTGWTVRLDGVAVNTFPFDGGLLAMDLPSGTHRVEAAFTPRFFRLGLGLSLSCLLAAALGALKGLRALGAREKS
jgi:uncharacterized membrane protein YfhO